MSIYVLLTTLTNEDRTMPDKVVQRIDLIGKWAMDNGARVVGQYSRIGGYDMVNVIEVSDDKLADKLKEMVNIEPAYATKLLGPYQSSRFRNARSRAAVDA